MRMAEEIPLILASASPRRSRILADAGFAFTVVPVNCREYTDLDGISPVDVPLLNAVLKARTAAATHPGAMVLGADTAIIAGNRMIGKPADITEAAEMLLSFSAASHSVVTGTALVLPDGSLECFSDITKVFFKAVSPDTVQEYLEKVNVLDKAGAYAIQEYGDMLIDHIEGSFSNVEGLPAEKTAALITGCREKFR